MPAAQRAIRHLLWSGEDRGYAPKTLSAMTTKGEAFLDCFGAEAARNDGKRSELKVIGVTDEKRT
jgi:hypothetical protein